MKTKLIAATLIATAAAAVTVALGQQMAVAAAQQVEDAQVELAEAAIEHALRQLGLD